jgi:deoxyribodipyrimidine photo-lyase
MKQKIVVYWARRDFRFNDNPALYAAVQFAKQNNLLLLPIYILDSELLTSAGHNTGYPRKLFLSKVLAHFSKQFKEFAIFHGSPTKVIEELLQIYQLEVFFNGDVEPYARNRDSKIANLVSKKYTHIFSDQTSVDLQVRSGAGGIYSVFTPFKKAVWQEFVTNTPIPKPDFTSISWLPTTPINHFSTLLCTNSKENLQDFIFNQIDTPWTLSYNTVDTISLDEIFQRNSIDMWAFQEDEVLKEFNEYVQNRLIHYKKTRDSLHNDAKNTSTSRVSVALKWGLVSPRTLTRMIVSSGLSLDEDGVQSYISELIWREFYRYILYHNPTVLDLEFQPKYQNTISWETNELVHKNFALWIQGKTGYPIVDAAMRQLSSMYWMHNRSRMIVASFLTKHLGIDWRWGQDYFRSMLLDLDEASNNGGWQWAASVGADPKPIRIFNPYLQDERYDEFNEYKNRWLPSNYNYLPIVDHKVARESTLKRYKLNSKSPVRDG